MYYVYILKCKNNNIYTGCTSDLKERVIRHVDSHVLVTKERRPVEPISYTAFKDKYMVFELEKYLKSGSGRAFISKHFINS